MISDDDVRAAMKKLGLGSCLPTSDGVYKVVMTTTTTGDNSIRRLFVLQGKYNRLTVYGPGPVGVPTVTRRGKVSDPWLPLFQLVKASLEYKQKKKR